MMRMPNSIAPVYEELPTNKNFSNLDEIMKICAFHNSFMAGGAARYCVDLRSAIKNTTHSFSSLIEKLNTENKQVDDFIADAVYNQHEKLKKNFYDKPSDIDIYSYDKKSQEKLLRALKKRYRKADFFLSKMSITFEIYEPNSVFADSNGKIKLQIIKPAKQHFKDEKNYQDVSKMVYGTPYEIIGHYDFSVCQTFIDPVEKKIYGNQFFVIDETFKKLRFMNFHENPILLFKRITKYMNKGYSLTMNEFFNIIAVLNNLPEEKKNIINKAVENDNLFKEEFAEILVGRYHLYIKQNMFMEHSGINNPWHQKNVMSNKETNQMYQMFYDLGGN